MEHLIPIENHGPVTQVEATLRQLLPQGRLGPAIANRQTGDAAAQFAQLGEMAAEGTASIEDQDRCGAFLKQARVTDTRR